MQILPLKKYVQGKPKKTQVHPFISVYNLEKKNFGIYLITTVSPISTTKRILDKETIS